ncbi:hypothetical protein FKP32DRAFT_1447164 [Trametes sanguinea]|nr:hypothetical protein FKP32DRAFT_1447164 [Trametes sanguinea]
MMDLRRFARTYDISEFHGACFIMMLTRCTDQGVGGRREVSHGTVALIHSHYNASHTPCPAKTHRAPEHAGYVGSSVAITLSRGRVPTYAFRELLERAGHSRYVGTQTVTGGKPDWRCSMLRISDVAGLIACAIRRMGAVGHYTTNNSGKSERLLVGVPIFNS